MLLTNRQVWKVRRALENDSSAKIKLSKTQLYEIGQSGGFLGRPLGSLLKPGLPLIWNVLKPLAKRVLISIGLTAAAAATDAAIHTKMFESSVTTLKISNEEMNDIIKIVKSLGKSGLLIKGFSRTIQNVVKAQKGGFIGMLLGTLGASLLGNLLAGKDRIRAGESDSNESSTRND